eukprot:8684328-Karenia_brevis.AAC.1
MRRQHEAEVARQQKSFQVAMDDFRRQSAEQVARDREQRERALVGEAERRHMERWQAAEGAFEQQRLELGALREKLAERDKLVQQKEDELAQ